MLKTLTKPRAEADLWLITIGCLYLLFSFSPALIASIIYKLSLNGIAVDLVDKPPEDLGVWMFFFMIVNLWWLVLATISEIISRLRPKNWVIRGGILGAIVALALLHTPFLLATPLELLSTDRRAGVGTGFYAFGVIVFAPVFGAVGGGIGSITGWLMNFLRLARPRWIALTLTTGVPMVVLAVACGLWSWVLFFS